MSYVLAFGSYTFKGTFAIVKEVWHGTTPISDLPRADGGVALPRVRGPKRFSVQGGFAANLAGITDLRTAVDGLKTALMAGPANMTLDSDRYYRLVYLDGDPEFTWGPTGYQRFVEAAFEMRAIDPFSYSTTGGTDTWSSPTSTGTHVVTLASGGVYAAPKFTFTLPGLSAININLKNNTSAASVGLQQDFTLDGTPTNTTIIVDGLLKTVTYGDGSDASLLFSGVIPILELGANTFEYTTSAGSVNSIQFDWVPRWE